MQEEHGTIELKHFKRVQQLGSGDVGLVDLVKIQGSDVTVAMKTIDKLEILERNKLHRLITEESILQVLLVTQRGFIARFIFATRLTKCLQYI